MKYAEAKEFARSLRRNMTPAEKLFWNKVRNRKFQNIKFYRQYILEHFATGVSQNYFFPDFLCKTPRLIIEIDGKIHDNQKEYDAEREKILTDMGYKVIRFTNEEVLNNWSECARVLENVIKLLQNE